MDQNTRILRVVIGLGIVALILVIGFGWALQAIPTWGATPDEVALVLPGDEIVPNPLVNWTHGITIDAPLQEVWGWVSQIGERRGGFYSYTFIENQMGNGPVYQNADRIVPEWQNPAPGTEMIRGSMQVKALEPGKWYLGSSTNEMGWTWLWYLKPINDTQTRLLVRSHIKPPGALSDNGMGMVLNLGGFVMEQAMLQGIKARAEGWVPPAYNEPVEIAVWLITLGMGAAAAVLFVTRRDWQLPIVTAVLAAIALFVFTFVQPPVGLRIFADIVLFALIGALLLTRFSDQATARSQNSSGNLKLKALHK